MNVFKHVRAFVLADPLIAEEIGTRFYPVKLPQDVTLPAVTCQPISDIRYTPLKGRASLARARYQFDVWVRERPNAASFAESQQLGALLLNRLEGKNITVDDDDVSPAEPRLLSFEFENARPLYETDIDGGLWRHSADYFVMYQTGNGPA